MAKKVTIKDIADMAGVSIATVSHVINRTRYVSPDLVEKIENIIIETGYHKKIEEKERRLKVGRQSEIVAVIPNVESTIYRDMVGYLKKYVSIQGYQFYIAITDNDIKEEAQVLEGLIQNKKTAVCFMIMIKGRQAMRLLPEDWMERSFQNGSLRSRMENLSMPLRVIQRSMMIY